MVLISSVNWYLEVSFSLKTNLTKQKGTCNEFIFYKIVVTLHVTNVTIMRDKIDTQE